MSDDRPGLPIQTYTHIWSSARVFYTINDFTLPRPISMMTAGIFLLSGIIWVPLIITLFHPPLTSPYTWMFLLGVPALAAYFGNRPIFEGKNFLGYLNSQIRYYFRPRYLTDMKSTSKPPIVVYENEQAIWEPYIDENEKRTKKVRKSLFGKRSPSDKKKREKQSSVLLRGKRGRK